MPFERSQDGGQITTSAESRNKFNEAGEALTFPGITIVYHVPGRSHDAHELTQEIITRYYKIGHEDNAIPEAINLPPASYHSTMFDLTTYPGRQEASPEDLIRFKDLFQSISSELQAHLPIRFGLDMNRSQEAGTSFRIPLRPLTNVDAEKADRMRQLIASTLRVRPDPDYHFHLTLSYLRRPVSSGRFEEIDNYLSEIAQRVQAEREPVVTVTRLELCTFVNMLKFTPQLTVEA